MTLQASSLLKTSNEGGFISVVKKLYLLEKIYTLLAPTIQIC